MMVYCFKMSTVQGFPFMSRNLEKNLRKVKKWIASDNLLLCVIVVLVKYRPNISKLQVQRDMKCLLMSHSSNVCAGETTIFFGGL